MTRGKKSILVVALVLALCAAMLFGATVAWFTKTTSISDNTIKVADYEVDLQYATTWGTWSDLTSTEQLLFTTSDDALKPGEKTGVKYIKIINNNDYAISAKVDIGTIAQTITGVESPDIQDNDKLKLYALTSGVTGAENDNLTERSAGTDGNYTLTIDNIVAKDGETPGEAIIAIQFELPTTAETPSVSNTFTIDVTTEQVHTDTEPTT